MPNLTRRQLLTGAAAVAGAAALPTQALSVGPRITDPSHSHSPLADLLDRHARRIAAEINDALYGDVSTYGTIPPSGLAALLKPANA